MVTTMHAGIFEAQSGQLIVRQAVAAENDRQLLKWGTQYHPMIYWLGILMEEIGEVAEALLATEEGLTEHGKDFVDRVYQLGMRAKVLIEGGEPDGISRVNATPHAPDLGMEIVQVAAVAVAMEDARRVGIVAIDPSYDNLVIRTEVHA